jgi:biotin synthase-related radical SAM superfamily protein
MSIQQIRYKIDLLCYGVRTNSTVEKIYSKQNPYNQRRTGNVGIQMLLGENMLPINIPVFQYFTENSPYEIIESDGKYFVKKIEECNLLIQLNYISAPEWYMNSISTDRHAGDYLLQEGTSTLITSITGSCQYADKGTACAFCAISNNNLSIENDNVRKSYILRSIDNAFENGTERFASINLTGGNFFSDDRGMSNYFPFVEYIRNKSNIPICLEVSPPKSLDIIDECIKKGVSAFMMNLEIWDEKLRKLFMPAKSLIKRDEYLLVLEHAVKLLGKGNVSSVLIVGLEHETSVLEAIAELIKIGVIPSIMPFRPNNGAVLERFQLPSPEIVMKLTKEVAKMLKENGFSMNNLPGCIGCGACTAEQDEFYRICKIFEGERNEYDLME